MRAIDRIGDLGLGEGRIERWHGSSMYKWTGEEGRNTSQGIDNDSLEANASCIGLIHNEDRRQSSAASTMPAKCLR